MAVVGAKDSFVPRPAEHLGEVREVLPQGGVLDRGIARVPLAIPSNSDSEVLNVVLQARWGDAPERRRLPQEIDRRVEALLDLGQVTGGYARLGLAHKVVIYERPEQSQVPGVSPLS
jgi:hypothetical protein